MMPILAVDLSGTKTLVALVEKRRVLSSQTLPTDRATGPDGWLEKISDSAKDWRGEYDGVGFAVAGHVAGGQWAALNTTTLNIPARYPLGARVREAFGFDPVLANGAQAAAFGEYACGAGHGQDVVFLTISTGVGGGIVADGRLLTGSSGLAGHFGQTRRFDGVRLEDKVSGTAMEAVARQSGHEMRAPELFAAARAGADWADEIVDASAKGVAALCADLKLAIDPGRIVIGGWVGMAQSYLERVTSHLSDIPQVVRPNLFPAALGANAGILGVSALFDVDNQ